MGTMPKVDEQRIRRLFKALGPLKRRTEFSWMFWKDGVPPPDKVRPGMRRVTEEDVLSGLVHPWPTPGEVRQLLALPRHLLGFFVLAVVGELPECLAKRRAREDASAENRKLLRRLAPVLAKYRVRKAGPANPPPDVEGVSLLYHAADGREMPVGRQHFADWRFWRDPVFQAIDHLKHDYRRRTKKPGRPNAAYVKRKTVEGLNQVLVDDNTLVEAASALDRLAKSADTRSYWQPLHKRIRDALRPFRTGQAAVAKIAAWKLLPRPSQTGNSWMEYARGYLRAMQKARKRMPTVNNVR